MSTKEYEQISGSYIAPIINNYFKEDFGKVKSPVLIAEDFKQVS
jgi:hypothetical protein